jgi:hypothetical protein
LISALLEMNTKSAFPGAYYAVFGVIEPALIALGLLPFTNNSFADQALPASPFLRHPIHPAAYVALFQLGHVYLAALVQAIVAFFIYSRLTPVRGGVENERMIRALVLQEGACKALLVPFAIGDVGAVIAVAFHALGWEATKNVGEWNTGVWSMVGLSVSLALALSRWAWFVGLGRWCSSSALGKY